MITNARSWSFDTFHIKHHVQRQTFHSHGALTVHLWVQPAAGVHSRPPSSSGVDGTAQWCWACYRIIEIIRHSVTSPSIEPLNLTGQNKWIHTWMKLNQVIKSISNIIKYHKIQTQEVQNHWESKVEQPLMSTFHYAQQPLRWRASSPQAHHLPWFSETQILEETTAPPEMQK